MAWQSYAACLRVDPELFFPTGQTEAADRQALRAKGVCGRCDVRSACLQWALETRADYGVWGGMDEDERRNLKRRDARARRNG